MHPADINAGLKKAGWNQARVGQSLTPPMTGSMVGKVIRGQRRSQRIEERISEILNIPLHRLWPKWHKRPKKAA